jgi:hypothetical protein
MHFFQAMRVLSRIALALLLAAASAAGAQAQKPLPLNPAQPAATPNRRLILKDGSYQVVRRYEIVDDRVRYISVERGGDWEELPAELVDWEATHKWERDHAHPPAEELSPAMKEVQAIDKEEADEREELKTRRPDVAKGLELPDEDAVFALDTFQGTPELVELLPVDLAMDAKSRHGLNTLNPLAASKAQIELDGAHAKVHLHVAMPIIYLSLASRDDVETVLSHALTVNTAGAREATNRKHGAHSPASGFVLVRAGERNAVRIIGAVQVSRGAVTQDEDALPATVEALPGKHWLKITPQKPLPPGEYALVEILSASQMNQSVWDFRVDPASGDNQGSIGPILK